MHWSKSHDAKIEKLEADRESRNGSTTSFRAGLELNESVLVYVGSALDTDVLYLGVALAGCQLGELRGVLVRERPEECYGFNRAQTARLRLFCCADGF